MEEMCYDCLRDGVVCDVGWVSRKRRFSSIIMLLCLNLLCLFFLQIIPSYGTCFSLGNNLRSFCVSVIVVIYLGYVVFSQECTSWVFMARGLVIEFSLFLLVNLAVSGCCWLVDCCERSLWCRRAISIGDMPSRFVFTFKFLRSCGVSAPRVCPMIFRLDQWLVGDDRFEDDLGEKARLHSTVLHQHVPDTRCRCFTDRSSLVDIYSSMFYHALFYVVVYQHGSGSLNHGTGM